MIFANALISDARNNEASGADRLLNEKVASGKATFSSDVYKEVISILECHRYPNQ